jgi:NADP-dependent 3-hydroxy acid dehydrogenase YdfG
MVFLPNDQIDGPTSPLAANINKADQSALTTIMADFIPTYKDVYPGIDAASYDADTFKDKVVLVTGAGSGIGKETALAFSEMGAKVVFSDWREDAAKGAAEEAKKFGNSTFVVRCDVTKLAETEDLYKKAVEKFGDIDVAVFAAGYGMFDKFAISREKDWWGLIETNLKGPTDFTRLVLPSMIKRKSGKLIYISSRVSSTFTLLNLGRRN